MSDTLYKASLQFITLTRLQLDKHVSKESHDLKEELKHLQARLELAYYHKDDQKLKREAKALVNIGEATIKLKANEDHLRDLS